MPECSEKLGCIEGAISILGTKWTGLVIRELAAGQQRFCELERSLPRLNPRTLSKRLAELESCEVIKHTQATGCYSLTDKGQDLLPILRKMAEWGDKHPRPAHWNVA